MTNKRVRSCLFHRISLAVLYLLFELIRYATNAQDMVSGYFTTIAAITLFGGVQLISIGILGEPVVLVHFKIP